MAANNHDPDLHLLFDPETLHQVSNVVLVPGRLNRRFGPVVVADRPWEGRMVKIGSGCGSVLFAEDCAIMTQSGIREPIRFKSRVLRTERPTSGAGGMKDE